MKIQYLRISCGESLALMLRTLDPTSSSPGSSVHYVPTITPVLHSVHEDCGIVVATIPMPSTLRLDEQ